LSGGFVGRAPATVRPTSSSSLQPRPITGVLFVIRALVLKDGFSRLPGTAFSSLDRTSFQLSTAAAFPSSERR
jgi:hypothetical protein